MTDTRLHGDRPIQSQDEDRFGFGALAERIADALTSQAAQKGFVLGLEGKWGSGKSSLLALVLKDLAAMRPDAVTAVEFRPWLIGDRDQLLTALFDDLAKAIAGLEQASGDATGATRLAAKSVAERVRGFARHLGPVGKLAGVAGLLIPGATAIGQAMETVAAAASEDLDEPTLVAQKDALSEALLELDCRIVIAIDDVDRLEPKEVAELLRLVRSVADFPNISYILCYDAHALVHAIEVGTGFANGAAYLEKIVQTEVAVPRPASFALRRWFSAELQLFAACAPHRLAPLQDVINETGERVLDSPRAVVRVLDSLRVYWPSLKDRVDLADLVWLRMIAVGSPNFYRWVETYLGQFTAAAGGRNYIGEVARAAMAAEMDAALASDGLDWERMQFEIERHLPGIQIQRFNKDQDERLFSRVRRASHGHDAKDGRLASPSHARIYFTLVNPPDTVTQDDLTQLRAAAHDGADQIAARLIQMGDVRGDDGGTKAERWLDQLRWIERDALLTWPIEALVMGMAHAADPLALASDGDDWGYPHIWYLVRAALRQFRSVLPHERFAAALQPMFEQSPSLGFLTYLLRDETFGHGVYGDRPSPSDRLTTPEEFDVIRTIMIGRYQSCGLHGVLAHRHATHMLYAWSQAGGRDDVMARVATRSADERWLLAFIRALYGPSSSLSLAALENFFASPVAVVRQIYDLAVADPAQIDAQNIIRSLKSGLHCDDDDDFGAILASWEAG